MKIDSVIQKGLEKISSIVKKSFNYDKKSNLVLAQKLSKLEKDGSSDIAGPIDGLAKTAQSALSGIDEKLEKIKEYAMEVEDGKYTDEEKLRIQEEVEDIKSEISSFAQNTEFNSIKLLDGTFQDMNISINPNGSGVKMSIQNSSLKSLGIDEFDITKDFDIGTVDNAIKRIDDSRNKLENLSSSLSRGIGVIDSRGQSALLTDSGMNLNDVKNLVNSLKSEQMMKQYEYYSQYRPPQEENKLDLLG